MECPKCGHENPQGEEFCAQCGEQLTEIVDVEFTLNENDASAEAPEVTPELLEEIKALTAPKFPIEVTAEGATDRGLVREHNEDDFLIFSREFPNHKIRFDLLIVTDGMGGGESGEIMSFLGTQVPMAHISDTLTEMQLEIVKVSTPAEELFSWLDDVLPERIKQGVQKANEEILFYGDEKGFKRDQFGATIVVAGIVSDLKTGKIAVHGWNEGDARCSWWNGAELVQLTKDHTLLGSPYRFLGRHRTIGGDPFSLEIWAGDYSEVSILLYSDGLWNMIQLTASVSVETLIEMAKHTASPEVEGAQPGDDNISVIKWQARAKKEEMSAEEEKEEKENAEPEQPEKPAPDNAGS